KNRHVSDVPTGYLRFLVEKFDGLKPWLRWHVEAELKRRGERYLPAEAVLADLGELLTVAVSAGEAFDHVVAAGVRDHVFQAFEELRQRHGIGTETDLVVPATPGRRTFTESP